MIGYMRDSTDLDWGKKNSPITEPEGPRGFQEVKVPRFRNNSTGWW